MADQPFDWSDYLRLAQELAARKDEACLRSSLSRAYYYVYHLALNRAERNGFVFLQGESTHGQLWRLFNKSPEPECINLGQIALRLTIKRGGRGRTTGRFIGASKKRCRTFWQMLWTSPLVWEGLQRVFPIREANVSDPGLRLVPLPPQRFIPPIAHSSQIATTLSRSTTQLAA